VAKNRGHELHEWTRRVITFLIIFVRPRDAGGKGGEADFVIREISWHSWQENKKLYFDNWYIQMINGILKAYIIICV